VFWLVSADWNEEKNNRLSLTLWPLRFRLGKENEVDF